MQRLAQSPCIWDSAACLRHFSAGTLIARVVQTWVYMSAPRWEEGSMDAIGRFVADAVLGIDTLWGGDVMCPSGTGRFIADSWFSDEPLPAAYTALSGVMNPPDIIT